MLPTAVVGSYSMPGWLERAKNDYLLAASEPPRSRRDPRRRRKAAIKDQEMAGVDIITDGELRRDNMIDYFAERLPGVQIDRGSKRFYYDFYDSVGALEAAHGLARPGRRSSLPAPLHGRRAKVSVTGPHSLVKRIRNRVLPERGSLRARYRAGDEPRS